MKKENKNSKVITTNRKAHFNYFLSDFTECGIALYGTEIKALRQNGANINDAYVVIRNNEMEVINMHIPHYKEGNIFNHDPMRSRKLLLHKKEIRNFTLKIRGNGLTIVPTKLYLRDGKAKLEIALAKGKKMYDKRESEKKRDDARYIDRALKEANK